MIKKLSNSTLQRMLKMLNLSYKKAHTIYPQRNCDNNI